MTDSVLDALLARYAKDARPVAVRFRDLVPWISGPDRLTHLIHPYPAKLLMHIPHFFLSNKILSQPGDIVLDPFCGSGTVLLEAIAAGRNACGLDANPLARLVSNAKTKVLDVSSVKAAAGRVRMALRSVRPAPVPDVVNLRLWFHPHVVEQLCLLMAAICSIIDRDIRCYFLVAFSKTVRDVSLADPRISVPVRLRVDKYPKRHWLFKNVKQRLARLTRVNVAEVFFVNLRKNIERMASVVDMVPRGVSAAVVGCDARTIVANRTIPHNTGLSEGSVQLIITSPPYGGAQKYIRSSSLSLGWLGLCRASELRALEETTIGREHYRAIDYAHRPHVSLAGPNRLAQSIWRSHHLRGQILGQYFVEMQQALTQCAAILKPKGFLVLVGGTNRVCGRLVRTHNHLTALARAAGLTPVLALSDSIRSRGLLTKRHHGGKPMTREWVWVLQK